jgi:hypothetical protein
VRRIWNLGDRVEEHRQYWRGNLKERENLKNLGFDERIKSK